VAARQNGGSVNLEHYKALLVAKEHEVISRRGRSGVEEQATGDGAAGDLGDDSVEDAQKSLAFTEDEADAKVLDEIRLALDRVADGSYGRCLVDEQPIDEKRLEAIPWAKHCTKHQAEIEATQDIRTPSL
jgi:RNA polymerase-binding transcription factor